MLDLKRSSSEITYVPLKVYSSPIPRSIELHDAGEVNVISSPRSSYIVSVILTSVSDTLPVFETVILYWIVSPGPLIKSPLSSTVADLVISIDGVALIRVTTGLSISLETAVLSTSSAVALTDTVLETPPASIAC